MQHIAKKTKDQRWQFNIWAPFAENMHIVFENEDKKYELEKNENGFWTKNFPSLPPDTDYSYLINNENKRPDPASQYQPYGVHGPSRLIDHEKFNWNDSNYKPIDLEEYIIYELHIAAFTPQADFDVAISRLYELKKLGITAVEIMPVAQFPGNRNWGYDGTFPYAVQNSYGGPNAFKRFINAAHDLGIAVILDVVYNHLGPEGNYLRDFGPYFTDHYKTPWGQAINFDQAHSPPVRDFFIENALYWFENFHIDALRLDALHAIFDMSAKHFITELVERAENLSHRLRKKLYLIGESDLNDVRLLKPIYENGCGLDAQWSDDFHHALHSLITGEDFGYYQDFGSISNLAKAFNEGFVYDWKYSKFRKRKYGSSSGSCPARQFVICSQNHDQVGNRMRGDRLSELVDFQSLKLTAACILLAPYIPLMFMGQEYAEENPFQYFISMNDRDLVQAVRTGRREEFSRFRWQGDCPDPQSEKTFEDSKIDWKKRKKNHHHVLLKFYRQLIKLRKSQPDFVTKQNFRANISEDQNILYWQRKFNKNKWLCIFNFTAETRKFLCPENIENAEKILDSAQKIWQGTGETMPERIKSKQTCQIPPKSVSLYQTET